MIKKLNIILTILILCVFSLGMLSAPPPLPKNSPALQHYLRELYDWVKPGIVIYDVESITSSTTLGKNTVALVDASGGAVTITLPAASSCWGRIYTIKKTDSSANFVTIAGTIDGDTNFVLEVEDEVAEVISDGSNWYII